MTSALRLLQSIVNRSRYTVVLLRSGATQQKHHIDNSSASSASSLLSARHFNSLGTVKRSILFEKPLVGGESVTQAATTTATRNHYTFNFPNNIVRYRRTTRPRKTTNTSTLLNYEQAQFVEKLGVTKSWNSWNTSNLYDSKREAESARDDILIRKFIFGTFHELISSEIIIKRRLNTINIGFLIKLPNVTFVHKTYFLCGYAEELLSSLLKCVVKIQPQSIYNKNDLIFRRW